MNTHDILLLPNVCFSGGAVGADQTWGNAWKNQGGNVVHFSFEGSHENVQDRHVLREDELREADPYLHRANEYIQRKFPSKDHKTNSLLRRNFFQHIALTLTMIMGVRGAANTNTR